jgi:hypothetical protein
VVARFGPYRELNHGSNAVGNHDACHSEQVYGAQQPFDTNMRVVPDEVARCAPNQDASAHILDHFATGEPGLFSRAEQARQDALVRIDLPGRKLSISEPHHELVPWSRQLRRAFSQYGEALDSVSMIASKQRGLSLKSVGVHAIAVANPGLRFHGETKIPLVSAVLLGDLDVMQCMGAHEPKMLIVVALLPRESTHINRERSGNRRRDPRSTAVADRVVRARSAVKSIPARCGAVDGVTEGPSLPVRLR